MRIIFKIASEDVIKMYYAGSASRHRGFAPVNDKEAQMYQSRIIGQIPDFGTFSDYDSFKIMKSDVLKNIRSRRAQPIWRGVDAIKLRKPPSAMHAQRMVVVLRTLWAKNYSAITTYLRDYTSAKLLATYEVYVVPGLSEQGEALPHALVVGANTPVRVAFGIMLEELLHAVIRPPKPSIFGIRPKPTQIKNYAFNEAYIAAHLFRLLNALKYPVRLRDSLVFDWQDGKRKTLVRRILKSPLIA